MPDPLAALSLAPDAAAAPPPAPDDPLGSLSLKPDAPEDAGQWVRRGILLINTKTHQALPATPPGVEPALGPEPAPAGGSWLDMAQAAATKPFGAPIAGAMEGVRDLAQEHPVLAAILGGSPHVAQTLQEEIPQGLTQDVAARAQQQRDAFRATHPTTGGATAEYLTDLGVQLLPMLAGAPAAVRGLAAGYTGTGAAPSLAAVVASAGVGAAVGGGLGYAGSYGQPAGARAAAAGQGAATGLAMGGLGGALAGRAPSVADAAETAPRELYEQAQAAAPPEARAAVADAWESATGHKAPDALPEEPPPPAAGHGGRIGVPTSMDPAELAAARSAGPQPTSTTLGGADVQTSPLLPQAEPLPSEAGYVSLPGGGKAAADLASDEVFSGARAPYVAATDKARFVAGLRYIDDAQAFPRDLGADMRSAYEQTPNPAIPGDTAGAVLDRVMQHPQGGQAALDAMDAWRSEAEELRQGLNAERAEQGLPEVPKKDNYLTLRLASDPEDQPAAPVQGGAITVEQARDFPTAYDAVQAGEKLAPGTSDWAGALRATRETYGSALAQRDLAGTLADFAGRDLADGRPAVALGKTAADADYVESTIPFVNQALHEAAGEGAPVSIFLHPQLAENLDPILRGTTSGTIGRAYDAVNSLLKQTALLGGFFHPFALTESLVDTLGLRRGLLEAASHGFGLPGLAQLAHYLGGGQFSEDAALRAIQWGTTLEPPTTDVESSALGRVLMAGQEWGAQPQTGPVGTLVSKGAQGVQAGIGFLNNALWTYHHLPAKVTAFNLLADAADKVRAGDDWGMGLGGYLRKDAIRAAPAADLYRGIARGVNDNFGGQNWRLMRTSLMSNPQALQAARRLMLAPDWLTSSARAFVSPLAPNPARSAMGINYYVNAAKLFGMYQLINQATSGHFTWQNGPGGTFDVHKLASLQVAHDAQGKPVFWNVGKHFLELPHLLFGRNRDDLPVVGPLAGKLAPVPRAAASLVQDATGRGSASQKAGRALVDTTSPLVPINVRQAWRMGKKEGPAGAAEGFFSPFPIGR